MKCSTEFCQIFISFAQVHNVHKLIKHLLTFDNLAKSLIRHGCGIENSALKNLYFTYKIENNIMKGGRGLLNKIIKIYL